MKNNQPYGYTGKPSPRRVVIKKGKYFNPNKYGLGGLIGTGLGAIGGSFIGQPMLGAQIGGMVGNQFDKKKEKEPEEIEEITMGSGNLGEYKNGGYKGYATGGYAKSMGGGSYKAIGRNHAQGGIVMSPDTEIEGGETINADSQGSYIFSDRLKVPKSNETFAERHEKLMSMKADKTAVDDLAEMQERVSGRKKRNLGNNNSNWGEKGAVMANGGYKPAKYATGEVPTPTTTSGVVNPPTPKLYEGATGSFDDEGLTTGSFDGEGLTTGDYIFALAPTAFNLGAGIFGKNKTEKPTKVARAKINDDPINYNINPELRTSAQSYRGILANPAASSQERLAALSMKGTADSRAYAQKNNVEMQMSERRNISQARLDSNTNAQNASMQERARQDRMAAEAQLGLTGNLSRQAISEASTNIMKMKAEGNMRERDKQMEKYLRTYYGDDPAVLRFFGEESSKKKVAGKPDTSTSYTPADRNIPPTPERPSAPKALTTTPMGIPKINVPSNNMDFSGRLPIKSAEKPSVPSSKPKDNIIEATDLELDQALTDIDTSLLDNLTPQATDIDTSITKGSINLPVQGEVTKGFGTQTHPELGTKTPSLGINIKTEPNQPVNSVGTGIVKRVANISGHGNSVIVDHNGTLVVYGNLGDIGVKEGDTINADSPIGNSGQNDVFFSIRENGKMVDPLTWINK